MKSKMKWYRSPKLLRQVVMIFFFLFLLHVAWEHQVKGGGPRGTPSVEAYCPFGGIENLYQFITTGGFIRRIEPSAMIMLAAVLLLTLVASRGFCGWVCPFGSVQEWIGMIGRKLFKKRFNPAGAWDRRLRYLKYVLLAVIVGLTWHTGTLVFRGYDPFLAFFHLGSSISELPWAYGALGVVLLGSLFVERFFCKYACPLGAVLGLAGKFGLTRIERKEDGCKGCNLCQKKCPAHIDFLSVTSIRSAECNQCLECVAVCPKPDVLVMRGPRWRLSHPAYAAVLVVGLFAMIGTSIVSGKWQSKPEAVSYTNAAGKLDTANIRGWMSLREVSEGYSVPLALIYRVHNLPERVPATARLNTIAREYKVAFEPDSLRQTVESYLAGKPVAKATEKKRPQPAEEQEIKGYMTLNEIALRTGVSRERILKTMGLPADIDGRKPVREWMHAQGKSVQDLREAVDSCR